MLEDAMNHRVFPLNESDRIFKLANSRPLALSDTTGRAGGLICPLKAVTVQPPKGGAA